MHQPYMTVSMLYDYVSCPHRAWLDLYGDVSEKERAIREAIGTVFDQDRAGLCLEEVHWRIWVNG